jgi:phage-related minor tail protein
MANEVKIRISGDVDRGSRSALDDLRSSAKDVGKTASETTDDLRNLGKEFDDLVHEAGSASGATDDLSEGLKDVQHNSAGAGESTGKLGGKLGGLKAAGGAAVLAGIAAAALALGKAFDMAAERLDFRAKLSTQLGLTGKDAAEAGKIASEAYADAFGTDIDQVGEAVRRVYQDIGKGSKEWTKGVTEDVLIVANTFDQDLGGVTRAVGQMMRTGLAKDAKSALDVITFGFQAGVDKADDLLDTFNEYGTEFRALGLDGQTAMGLLSQGLKAGARDADTVADALKEFAIRGIDGSKAVAQGFSALGLSSKKMTADLAAGGDRAKEALGTTLERLKAIKDPAERSTIAVALFGTKAEDLKDSLFALNTDTAAAQLGQVAGAADRASAAMGDTPRAKIEKFKRSISEGVKNALADALDRAWTAGEKFAKWADEHIKESPRMQDAWKGITDAVDDLGKFLDDDIKPAMEWFMNEAAPILEDALNNVRDAFDDVKNSGVPWSVLLKALAVVLGAVAGVIAGLVVGALLALSWQLKMAAKLVVPLWEAFQLLARIALETMGNILHTAAIAFGWIPGIGPKLRAADKEFQRFSKSVLDSLRRIPSVKTVNIQALVNGRRQTIQQAVGSANAREGRSAAFAHGGIRGAADGGLRGGLTWTGENGPELLDLPPGTTVHSAPDSQRIAATSGGGSREPIVVRFVGDSEIAALLLELIRRIVRTSGQNDVQLLFGGAPA